MAEIYYKIINNLLLNLLFIIIYFIIIVELWLKFCGASVAKWLPHLPFTSEAAGSSLSENFLNATRTQSSCEKSKSQRSAESRGFSPGTPVSSHRESLQGGLGKKGPQ